MKAFELFQELLKNKTISEIASDLDLSSGTVKRWVLNKSVPISYTLDLMKESGEFIDYSEFSSKEKDQFFTPESTCRNCLEIVRKTLTDLHVSETDYIYIEPGAGSGAFTHILPSNSINIDVEPRHPRVVQGNFLEWSPEDQTKKYIVIGNPPFGLRGRTALQFINHSYSFADFVCFILPQSFESDGKGSPRKRVKGYNLLYSEKTDSNFSEPDSQKEVVVNVIFQIWSKIHSNERYLLRETSNENVKVYSLSDGGTSSSTRNKLMFEKCDIYLPSTCFGKENVRIYNSFRELPNARGYGVVFLKNKKKLIEIANKTDWSLVAFLSTNSSYGLRTSQIQEVFK